MITFVRHTNWYFMSKAANTRFTILQKAFELIYANGYQATSIDDIIATTKVTKGAFYYHFKTKDEMGLAIIHEILNPTMLESFIEPFKNTTDPNKEIYSMTKQLLFENPFLLVQYGCPVSNLTQEMTPWNEEFSKALNELILKWQNLMVSTIKNGIKTGYYRKNIHPEQVTYFLMSGYWGIRNFGKLTNNTDCYTLYLKELRLYLNGLK